MLGHSRATRKRLEDNRGQERGQNSRRNPQGQESKDQKRGSWPWCTRLARYTRSSLGGHRCQSPTPCAGLQDNQEAPGKKRVRQMSIFDKLTQFLQRLDEAKIAYCL